MTVGNAPIGSARACRACLRHAWLIDRLAAHLEPVRSRIEEVLSLGTEELLAAVAGAQEDAIRGELDEFDTGQALRTAADAGIEAICRCDPAYPQRLRALPVASSVVHVAGGLDRALALAGADPVAIVGSRRATQYGLEVARGLGRRLALAGVTVVSGMAIGVDAAAHAGALMAGGQTIAVLPAGAQRAYPAGKRALHAEIRSSGAALSELPGHSGVWRWMFPARNRIIAGLAALTVVVEASERSGALVTARLARSLGRPVGAVPGRVSSSMSTGTNALLAGGAHLIRDAQDVLDLLYGAGARSAPQALRPSLAPELDELLTAIAEGHDTPGALERAGFPAEQGLAALASLELAGYVRREVGGRFSLTT